jgi:hypothetical protein
MGTILMRAPLLWAMLPVPWSAEGAAPALVSVAIGSVALWRFGPRRRTGPGSTRPADRTDHRREIPPGPDAGPPWR